MDEISDELAARLQGEALSLCLCWTLSRQDGVVVRLTDHDQDLVIDDETYRPGAAIEAGHFTQNGGLKPGQAAGGGVLSSDFITLEDLTNGIWDRCRVRVDRVDWRLPSAGRRHIWSGYLSEIEIGERGAFEAELVSLKSDLERPVGRVLQRGCDAVLGDTRCGFEIDGGTCDGRFETCRDVFANTENFRGFPHIPGNDFILSGPAASGNDGGQR